MSEHRKRQLDLSSDLAVDVLNRQREEWFKRRLLKSGFNTAVWLKFDTTNHTHVSALQCSVCTRFHKQLEKFQICVTTNLVPQAWRGQLPPWIGISEGSKHDFSSKNLVDGIFWWLVVIYVQKNVIDGALNKVVCRESLRRWAKHQNMKIHGTSILRITLKLPSATLALAASHPNPIIFAFNCRSPYTAWLF